MNTISYQTSQVITGVKAMLTALHNIAAGTENKTVDNRLAANQLKEVLATVSAADPSDYESTIKHVEVARMQVINIFLREDVAIPVILSTELNKQVAYIGNLLASLAVQLETLRK
ncbi:hypothetical protein [Vibrio phage vB_ValS_PJ32]|nr:hypothetical protein [Vibrio phage vB_ValS_PJ32]